MDIRVSHISFQSRLAAALAAAGGNAKIGLRLDGGDDDPCISVTVGSLGEQCQEWCVGTEDGKCRLDNWTLYRTICRVLGLRELSDELWRVYNQAINHDPQGWVVLTVQNNQPAGVVHQLP